MHSFAYTYVQPPIFQPPVAEALTTSIGVRQVADKAVKDFVAMSNESHIATLSNNSVK